MEPLITRDELTAYLFHIADIAVDVKAIRRQILDEEGDGGREEAD